MRRGLAGLLALTITLGGAAACDASGSDEAGDPTTTADAGAPGAAEGSGNAEVDAYCAAVDAYVPLAQEAAANPGDVALSQRATEAANALAEPLAAVPEPTTLDPDAAYVLEQCMIRSAEAALPPQ